MAMRRPAPKHEHKKPHREDLQRDNTAYMRHFASHYAVEVVCQICGAGCDWGSWQWLEQHRREHPEPMRAVLTLQSASD
jgi:hypothetical protein